MICKRTGIKHNITFIRRDHELLIIDGNSNVVGSITVDSMDNDNGPIGENSYFILFNAERNNAQLDKNIIEVFDTAKIMDILNSRNNEL